MKVMKNIQWLLTLMAGVLLAISMVGCSGGKPPEALTEEELPGALSEAFSGAEAGIKTLVDGGVADFQAGEYMRAVGQFNQVAQNQNLSDRQRGVISRAIIAANDHIQMQGTQGDPRATQFLKYQGANK
jgi:hypothetical protein